MILDDKTKAHRGYIPPAYLRWRRVVVGKHTDVRVPSKVRALSSMRVSRSTAQTRITAPRLFTYSKNIASKSDACCCGQFADSPDTQVVKNAAVQAATVASRVTATTMATCASCTGNSRREVSNSSSPGAAIFMQTPPLPRRRRIKEAALTRIPVI